MGGKEKRKRAEEEEEVEDSDEEVAEAVEAAEASTSPAVDKGLAATDGGVWFVLEKASLEAAKVGKVEDW